MVILDSDHSRAHVLEELRQYGPLVTPGCYLVVADTRLGYLDAKQTPQKRSKMWLKGNEPLSALQDYLRETDRFEVDPIVNGKLFLAKFAQRLSPMRLLSCRSNGLPMKLRLRHFAKHINRIVEVRIGVVDPELGR